MTPKELALKMLSNMETQGMYGCTKLGLICGKCPLVKCGDRGYYTIEKNKAKLYLVLADKWKKPPSSGS